MEHLSVELCARHLARYNFAVVARLVQLYPAADVWMRRLGWRTLVGLLKTLTQGIVLRQLLMLHRVGRWSVGHCPDSCQFTAVATCLFDLTPTEVEQAIKATVDWGWKTTHVEAAIFSQHGFYQDVISDVELTRFSLIAATVYRRFVAHHQHDVPRVMLHGLPILTRTDLPSLSLRNSLRADAMVLVDREDRFDAYIPVANECILTLVSLLERVPDISMENAWKNDPYANVLFAVATLFCVNTAPSQLGTYVGWSSFIDTAMTCRLADSMHHPGFAQWQFYASGRHWSVVPDHRPGRIRDASGFCRFNLWMFDRTSSVVAQLRKDLSQRAKVHVAIESVRVQVRLVRGRISLTVMDVHGKPFLSDYASITISQRGQMRLSFYPNAFSLNTPLFTPIWCATVAALRP